MIDLDHPYHRLEPLPRELWLASLVNGIGDCGQRLADLDRWRRALEAGELPPADADFGDAKALAPMRAVVAELGLPSLCRGTPAVAQQLLRTLLWHLDRLIDRAPATSRAQAIADGASAFRAEWALEKSGLEDLLALLQGLGDLAALSWDEWRGHLHSRDWREAQRISRLLPHLRTLAELIRRLGRTQRSVEPPPSTTPPQADPRSPPTAVPTTVRVTRLPDAPGELRGIRLSGRLERMLGSEAAQIRHPVMHRLWRARLAESRLLTYESEAVLMERVPDASARARPIAARPAAQTLERGPMLLCVDTSGSMRGAPEQIAKAVAIEVLRVARAERRGCKLIAFGGPGELVERELEPTRQGLRALLELIGQSFDGGTDVQTPIERAIELTHQARWASADLLIVSDGEFGCTAATLARLDAARAELGLRVQGILVGDRETMGLLEVCDDIHWVRDWRRFDAEAPRTDGFVPVHTSSLTALYFPNALSERAARSRRP